MIRMSNKPTRCICERDGFLKEIVLQLLNGEDPSHHCQYILDSVMPDVDKDASTQGKSVGTIGIIRKVHSASPGRSSGRYSAHHKQLE
jgi:hypothetical protein